MNDELQKKLLEIISSAQAAGRDAFLFGKEQIPDVIQQLLKWKLAEAALCCFLGLAFLLLAYWMYRVAKPLIENVESLGVFPAIAGAVSAVIGLILIAGNIATAVQIWVAPKVYLLEYAASLMKGR